MNLAKVKLTIGGKTFETGDRVTTPDGAGAVLSADPFADEEILVQLDSQTLKWFPHRVVEHEEARPA